MTTRSLTALLLLTHWLGAATIVAVSVAPAAFAVLPTRALAGALVGRVLPHIFVSGIFAGLAVALSMWTDRGARYAAARAVAALVTVAACAVAQWIIAPRIERVRAAIGPSVEALATTDPLRMQFGRLHGLSVLMMGIGMIAALVALVLSLMAARTRA